MEEMSGRNFLAIKTKAHAAVRGGVKSLLTRGDPDFELRLLGQGQG